MGIRVTNYTSRHPVKILTAGDDQGRPLLIATNYPVAQKWGQRLGVPEGCRLSVSSRPRGVMFSRLILIAPDHLRLTSTQVMDLIQAAQKCSPPPVVREIREALLPLIHDPQEGTPE